MSLEYGQEVDFGVPEKDDCIFVGWFSQNGQQITDGSGKGIWTYEGNTTLTSYDLKKIDEMLTYYADKGCEVKALSDYIG